MKQIPGEEEGNAAEGDRRNVTWALSHRLKQNESLHFAAGKRVRGASWHSCYDIAIIISAGLAVLELQLHQEDEPISRAITW